MDILQEIYLPLIMWSAFVCLVLLFVILYRWAKKQKGAALAVGLFIQMFLPNPSIQQTIEWVSESKAKSTKKDRKDQSSEA